METWEEGYRQKMTRQIHQIVLGEGKCYAEQNTEAEFKTRTYISKINFDKLNQQQWALFTCNYKRQDALL